MLTTALCDLPHTQGVMLVMLEGLVEGTIRVLLSKQPNNASQVSRYFTRHRCLFFHFCLQRKTIRESALLVTLRQEWALFSVAAVSHVSWRPLHSGLPAVEVTITATDARTLLQECAEKYRKIRQMVCLPLLATNCPNTINHECVVVKMMTSLLVCVRR